MNLPNRITLSRIILSILVLLILVMPLDKLGIGLPDITVTTSLRVNMKYIVCGILFFIASITDFIDGHIARKRHMVTDFGKLMDAIADKMLVNLAFLILVASNVIPLWVFAIILVRDFAVDGMRMMAAKNKVTIAASILGKLKTVTQMLAIIIMLLNLILCWPALKIIGDIVLYIALALTVISGLSYLKRGWKVAIK